MKHRISRITVGQCTSVVALFYAGLGVLYFPIFLIMGMTDPELSGGGGFLIPFAMIFVFPLIGALIGAVGSALYNLVAKSTGGLEIQLDEAAGDPEVAAIPSAPEGGA